MRVGLLGGTFDPPHIGHLLAAVDAYEALELDRLIFIPAGTQPFKQDAVRATPEQRLEMLRLMIAGDPRFEVDPVEIERGGLSYTVETIEAIGDRFPEGKLFLLIGEDLAGQIGSWRDPEGIARRASIVVLTRRHGDEQASSGRVPLQRLPTRRVDISSSEVRDRRAAGRSIAGFVTEAVAGYVRSAGLYR